MFPSPRSGDLGALEPAATLSAQPKKVREPDISGVSPPKGIYDTDGIGLTFWHISPEPAPGRWRLCPGQAGSMAPPPRVRFRHMNAVTLQCRSDGESVSPNVG